MSLAPAGPARPAPAPAPAGDRDVAASAAPRLRVLGRPRHTQRFVLAALAIAAAGIFGVVSLNALAAEAAFEARALEREVTELSLRYDELTAEVASLSAPSRVRRVAQDELGMVPAPAPGFLLTRATAGSPAGGRLVGFDEELFDSPRGGAHALHAPHPEPGDRRLAGQDAVKQALGER